ncbi:MAG: hypothetical protein EBZ47_10230, partial [Chlamydiae bacterium]|nr:hypothetical protein [Chlamydiota bacterium]
MNYASVVIVLFLQVAHLFCSSAERRGDGASVIIFNNSEKITLNSTINITTFSSSKPSSTDIICSPLSLHELITSSDRCRVKVLIEDLSFEYQKNAGGALFIMLTPSTEGLIVPFAFSGELVDIDGLLAALKNVKGEIFTCLFTSELFKTIKHFIAFLNASSVSLLAPAADPSLLHASRHDEEAIQARFEAK